MAGTGAAVLIVVLGFVDQVDGQEEEEPDA